jgi:hypothetical protein
MPKNKQVQPSITWRVGDGPVHEIPDGAEVTFRTEKGEERTVSFGDGGSVFQVPMPVDRKKR